MEDPRVEWTINHEKRKMGQSVLSTEAKKRKYIHDVKSGLGELIKEEPNLCMDKSMDDFFLSV